ncbi:hypothetical protein LUZ63_000082 [Rhynchospora breviuscula]|uniref:Jacalin-type lectin domain-containing protein n=1 Tax=Rhynchospora breviuscula TaxID=2022672 RepID=A0A9Q0HWI4_9POAL|nr:hypothetical protein LUZ63_000082 [Rhynchospora breviuscula]
MAPLTKLGPCGGNGGAVRDMVLTGVTRIVKIGIRHGAAIDALIVWYERNCCLESTGLWGGGGGCLTEITLRPNEYITSISGHIGNMWNCRVVKSLTLVTNFCTYGPYGTQQGHHFQLSCSGGQIVGFHARCGLLLDAIGVYVKVNYTCGNSVSGGCGHQRCCRCVCGRQVWGRCCQPWYNPCACGRWIWGGCGQPCYNPCACGKWIWKGCGQHQYKRCRCGR